MTPHPTKEEIEEAKEECSVALTLAAHTEERGPVLYRLRHESFPYAYRPGTEDQYLTVCIDRQGNFAICDLGGFLTFVETKEELSEILHAEAKEPGALREMITGRNNIKEMKMWRGKKRKDLAAHYDNKPTYNKPKPPEINLDDLELTI